MEFEWDDTKNRRNFEKHAISFEDARKIFDGFTVDAIDNRFNYGEERIISIGMVEGAAIVAVVHTDRHGVCRIISARPAKSPERRLYDKALQQTFDA